MNNTFLNAKEISNAHAFIIYMMVGSYFKEARCQKSGLVETYESYYHLLPLKQQYQYEEKCIDLMEKDLRNFIPREFLEDYVEVFFYTVYDRKTKRNYRKVVFEGEKFTLAVVGKWKHLEYELMPTTDLAETA